MKIPSSTYRIQLHEGFAFKDLESIIDYLHQLGVSTIYASPVLKSRKGSMHGYDVTDPHTLDPELGTIDDLKRIAETLRKKGMTWLQDIVPNHMAFDTGNSRLMDVLERGPDSPYYGYFDINWNHSDLRGKVLMPFLGSELESCIERNELKFSLTDDGFLLSYFETSYPVSVPAALVLIKMKEGLQPFSEEFENAARDLKTIREWKKKKRAIARKILSNPQLAQEAHDVLRNINSDPVLMRKVIDSQYYLPAYWKTSDTRINYRRFFTVNELICLRMDEQPVFDEYHRNIKALYDQGIIQGVRVDHIDGLFDPARYILRLRQLLGDDAFIIAEKILEANEKVPETWSLQGTSGYEFLSYVNQLFTDRWGGKKLLAFYKELVPDLLPYGKLVTANKKLILENHMRGEWDNLVALFVKNDLLKKHDRARIKQAIGALMLSFPVYRIYPETLHFSSEEKKVMDEAFKAALLEAPEVREEIDYLYRLFFPASEDEKLNPHVIHFLKRLMQFTGPLTAKGVEDTTFYVYNPLISHDEVGDAPSTLGISVNAFHSRMLFRRENSCYSLNATATHDTKRGEDTRLRLNVLSEIADVWENHVREWSEMNTQHRKNISGTTAPTTNDEWLIYQSLVGGYPEDLSIDETFLSRFDEFLTKAMREAKVNTSWSEPNKTYEDACLSFVRRILDINHLFRQSIEGLVSMISRYAQLYALSQVLIKCTAPGIPDIYQGCELWDYSFVDPDNRRPVNYPLRRQLLQEIISNEGADKLQFFHFLRSRRNEGYEKMFVTWKVLSFRRTYPELFLEGNYQPLEISGREPVAMAYARHKADQWVLVVIPLGLAKNRQQDQPFAEQPESSPVIQLPDDAPAGWTNLFTGEKIITDRKLSLFDAFKDFPVAMMVGGRNFQIN
jgi:(1->4)-alpha-D-glucan 1-alpha-D-glucosylmutase